MSQIIPPTAWLFTQHFDTYWIGIQASKNFWLRIRDKRTEYLNSGKERDKRCLTKWSESFQQQQQLKQLSSFWILFSFNLAQIQYMNITTNGKLMYRVFVLNEPIWNESEFTTLVDCWQVTHDRLTPDATYELQIDRAMWQNKNLNLCY